MPLSEEEEREVQEEVNDTIFDWIFRIFRRDDEEDEPRK